MSHAQAARVRVAIISITLAVLLGLLGTWWFVRQGTVPTALPQRPSILEQAPPQAAAWATATQSELLEVADREVESLLARFPATAAALNVSANRHFLTHDMQAAEQTWKEALDLDPRNPDALFGLANLAFQAGEYDRTIALCENLQRTNPGNPRVPVLLADAFLNKGQAELAVLTLEQHILSEPTSLQALNMLGSAHLSLRNYGQAIACFEQALKYAPDSKDAAYGLGQAYTRQGEPDKGAEYMQLFTKLAQTSGQANTQQAQAFEDRDQAAHVAAQVYLDSALVYKAAGDLPAAQTRMLQALTLQPDVVAWLEELQRTLQQQGLQQEAIDVGERLVELNPQDLDQWLTLGSLYAELERPEPAITAFRKAIELAPDDPRCQAAEDIIRQLK